MPLIVAKLITDDDVSDLDAAVDAYKATATELQSTQRAMAADDFEEPDGDMRMALLLCHGGIDVPGTGTKTADLQHVNVVAEGDVSELQDAIDEALSLVVHQTVTDANLDLVANEISSATAPFTTGGEDDGRKVRINGELRNIVSVTSTSVAVYDGDPLTGNPATVEILGAEVLQDARLEMQSRSGQVRMHALLACEGEAY